jgi:Tol biopolymer transport system component
LRRLLNSLGERGILRAKLDVSTDQLAAKPIPGTEGASNPFLSPDGRWVAFAYPRESPWTASSKKADIYALAIDGSREIAIVTHPADDNLLGWTPDGRAVLFSSDRSGSWDSRRKAT